MASMREDVKLELVSSSVDVGPLTEINGLAMEGDPLKKWMELFTENTEDENTRSALTSAISDPEYRIVKATIDDTESGRRIIVGFVHWFTGYIVVDRTDLAVSDKSPASAILTDASTESNEGGCTDRDVRDDERQTKIRRLKLGNAKYVETRNHYISRIQGNRHSFVRRIMVHPNYQGRGIGGKLLRYVTADADRQRMACWLFARPAGLKLYTKMGFVTVATTQMDEPEEDFACPETYSMIRLASNAPGHCARRAN